MIGIYKITNLITGQSYIGQSKHIEQRFMEHCHHHAENSSYSIGKAIYKYGKENFSFEVLEECEPERMDELEDYYIIKYNSIENGYNTVRGGKKCSGEANANTKLTEEDVYFIREAYKNKENAKDVYNKNFLSKISYPSFKRVWDGRGWTNNHMDVYTEEDLKLKLPSYKGDDNKNSKISDSDIYEIREAYNNKQARQEVYKKYKDQISEEYFKKIWNGFVRSNVHMDVYTEENKDFQRKQSISVGSHNNIFSDEEVKRFRKEYINGKPIKTIYREIQNSGVNCLYNTVYDMVKGHQYQRIPKPAFHFKK